MTNLRTNFKIESCMFASGSVANREVNLFGIGTTNDAQLSFHFDWNFQDNVVVSSRAGLLWICAVDFHAHFNKLLACINIRTNQFNAKISAFICLKMDEYYLCCFEKNLQAAGCRFRTQTPELRPCFYRLQLANN